MFHVSVVLIEEFATTLGGGCSVWHTHSIYISDILYVHMIISAAVVVPAAEDHRERPHTLEQQRGLAVTQV